MQITYEQALQVAEELKTVKRQAAELSSEISLEQHELAVIKAKIERGLIRKVGGEKQLAPTFEDRERIFTVACDADEEYKRRWQDLHEKNLTQSQAIIEISTIEEKLTIMLQALRSEQHEQDSS